MESYSGNYYKRPLTNQDFFRFQKFQKPRKVWKLKIRHAIPYYTFWYWAKFEFVTKLKLPVLISCFQLKMDWRCHGGGGGGGWEGEERGRHRNSRGERKDGLDIQSCLNDRSFTYISSCFIEMVIIWSKLVVIVRVETVPIGIARLRFAKSSVPVNIVQLFGWRRASSELGNDITSSHVLRELYGHEHLV